MTQDHHLRVVKLLMMSLGIWPLESKSNFKKIYDLYFILGFIYLSVFELSQMTRLVILLLAQSWEELFVNLGVALTYTLSIFKIYFLRTPGMQGLIKQIQSKEKEILSGDNEDIKKIYNDFVSYATLAGIINVSTGTICISMYFINPLLYNFVFDMGGAEDDMVDANVTNLTEPVVQHKFLIFSAYLPFNTDEHYVQAYLLHFFGGLYGYSYTVYSDTIFFTIYIYCIGQIKILQHFLQNMYEYSVQQKERSEKEISVERAEFEFQEKCIFYHREIIAFVDSIDQTLSTFMLFEFLIASLKISLLILQILKDSSLNFGSLTVLSYVIVMLMELYYFYWNANEIILESTEGITESIFYGNWYKLGNNVKKNLVMIFLRARKPCKISIGPFYIMSLQAALSILKACYYYICIIKQQSE